MTDTAAIEITMGKLIGKLIVEQTNKKIDVK
jgi:hypothetical protein